jgi:hypothetical protein
MANGKQLCATGRGRVGQIDHEEMVIGEALTLHRLQGL